MMDTQGEITILVIDDEEAVRHSFSDYLEDLGYRVLAAENGRAGVEIFNNENVDLVLVDLRMPEMGGLEVLSHIKEKSEDTPLIVASGTGVISDAVEALHRGAWDYVLKPVKDWSVLSHAVDMALEKAQLKEKNRRYQKHLEEMVAERTEKLERANENLRENERQSQLIFDNIRAGIVIVETHTRRVRYVNPAAAEMIGMSPEEILGFRCHDIFCPREGGMCPILDFGQEIETSEKLLKSGDGREIPVLRTVTRAAYRSEECLLEILVDLTAQRAAAAEKSALEIQLRQAQKMEALGTLAGGIAHDFNNILGAVIGYSELSVMELEGSNPLIHGRLKSILHACNRAKELVSQILAFSRMHEHMLTPIRIDPIVKEALKLLKASMPADIHLNTRINSSRQVMADATQIHQVIMNLCTNAYHAMEKRGGTLTVSLESIFREDGASDFPVNLVSGNYLKLSVEDTGVGIRPSIMENIFDPYFTTKEKDKGTGLGLAVVHGIIKGHGGVIDVKSRIGEGTVFRVFLPVTDDNSEKHAEPRASLPRGTERILLVDDEKDLVDIGCHLLGHLGYDVTGAAGSPEALNTFKKSPRQFDLVITDFNMPVMKGDRLAEEIIHIRPGIPILLCTGFSERVDKKRARRAGIHKLLKKPLAMSILAEAVREVLDETDA